MELVETRMAAGVARTLDSVRRAGGVGLVTAPAGAGTSVAVMMAARTRPWVRRVTLIEGLDTARSVYMRVAAQLGQDTPPQWGATEALMAVVGAVERLGAVLVVDQCWVVRRAAQIDALAGLADQLPALVLAGPPALRARARQHEQLASLTTVPVQHEEGVTLAELRGVLTGFSDHWIEVVHGATGGCWRGIHVCVEAAERAVARGRVTTAALGAAEAQQMVAAVLLNPRAVELPEVRPVRTRQTESAAPGEAVESAAAVVSA